jgi:hypothetical protein
MEVLQVFSRRRDSALEEMLKLTLMIQIDGQYDWSKRDYRLN